MSNQEIGENLANLTDAEIQVLHEIVQLANQKPGPAFGPGLFAAYDEAILRREASDEESRKYFTFICRMLWGRKQHETLLERFVGLLAEAGISVEPITDDEASTEYADQGEQNHDLDREEFQRSFDRSRLGSRDGKNGVLSSAETLHGEEETPASLRKSSLAPTMFAQAPKSSRPFSRRPRRSQSEDTGKHGIAGLERGRLSTRAPSAQLPSRRGRRNTSVSSTRSLKIQRVHAPVLGHEDAYSADDSDLLDATHSRRHSITSAAPPLPQAGHHDARSFLPPELFQRSDEQLEAIAETFWETKDRIIQRRLISGWNQKATQTQAVHNHLLLLAHDANRSKLLKDSWKKWRSKLDDKRLDQEWRAKQQQYLQLEQHAIRAREANLKWAALSHLRNMALEERERTSVAKRYITRKRHFTAWKNLTESNEFKVRQFVLKCFFSRWLQRLYQIQDREEEVAVSYATKNRHQTYWTWFWAYMNRRAPITYEDKLKRQCIRTWRDEMRRQFGQEFRAEDQFLISITKNNLLSWRSKTQQLLALNSTAEEFRSRRLLGPILQAWRREAALAPRETIIASRVENTLQCQLFRAWHTRALQSRQAAGIDQRRVLRNAFTTWNDQLRTNFLKNQISARLKMDALHKFQLAARSSIAERERNRRLVGGVMDIWLCKAQNRQRTVEGAEATFEASQRRRTLHSALSKLYAAHQHQEALENEAYNFRRTRLLYGGFAKLQQQLANIDLMHRKANAAEFYILSTKTLKRWSRSTREHQKHRKREAYTTVRRMCKMNLASEMLGRMQIQLAHLRNLDRNSVEFQEDRVVRSTISLFRSWKQRASVYMEQDHQAHEYYHRKLVSAVFGKSVQKMDQIQLMTTQARELSAGAASVEAMTCIRKLDRRLFQIKGQDQWALALREKHLEKHRKNMLRYWYEQTASRRKQVGGQPPMQQDEFRTSTIEAPALEEFTVFDNTAWNLDVPDLHLDTFAEAAQQDVDATFFELEGLVTSTPMPGYLRTPSKRSAARAKARGRLAANAPATTARTIRFAYQPTPATAPARGQSAGPRPADPPSAGPSITPFEHKLREQGYTSPSVERRTPAFGDTSRFGASVGSVGRFGATPARSAFAGFEDIAEVSEERSRG